MATTRALLAAASVSAVAAFQCTGFDPVYTPEGYKRFTKRAAYEESVRRANEVHSEFTAKVEEYSMQLDATGGARAVSSSRQTQRVGAGPVPIVVQPFRLDQVSLPDGSLLKTRQDRDLAYLLSDVLQPDNVLYNFYNTSGIPIPADAQPWGGWEDPTCLLRGHFSGHWLSAMSLMYNSTGNGTVKARLDAVIDGLAAAQAALAGTPPAPGYVSGFPASQFDDLENLVPYPKQWSPYYTIHKIMAGLRDAYLFTGSTKALAIAEGMASYFRHRVDAVIARGTIALWHAIQNQEFGGMNEVLYDLYSITGNSSYMETAHYFDKACFLGPLALNSDDLDTMHANAHEPVVIGAARRYELTGDTVYSTIATNFHSILTTDHAYATGSGNHGEYWGTPGRLGDTLDGDTEETCTSYNMLKLGRHVFGWTGDVAYSDWYERLYTNGILSTQRPRDTWGSYIYMLPLSTINGTSKGWGDPRFSMTCCYGTGVENFAKIGDSIYLHGNDGSGSTSSAAVQQQAGLNASNPQLWVSLYHSSAVTWPLPAAAVVEPQTKTSLRSASTTASSAAGGPVLTLSQASAWDGTIGYGQLTSTLTVGLTGAASVSATISLRVPSWAASSANGSSITVNGQPIGGPITPLSWADISRTWANGDVIVATYPMSLRVEWIRDDRPQYATTGALLAGPFLLVSASPAAPNPVISNGTLYGDATDLEPWIAPLTPVQRNWTSLASPAGGQGMFLRHEPNSMAAQAYGVGQPLPGGTDAQDSTFVLYSPGLTGKAGSVSIEATNYPGYYLCAASPATAGSALTFLNYNSSASPGYSASACSFTMHSPGLNGQAGSVSLELASAPGMYASWYNSGGGSPITAQAVNADPSFANYTTWTPSSPNAPVPAFAYRARASAAARAAGYARDFNLYPIMDADTEDYVSYFVFST